MSWTVSDILDVEAQVAADRQQLVDNGGDRSAQLARDRRLAEHIENIKDISQDQAILRAWAAGLRRDDGQLAGVTIRQRWSLVLRVGAVVMLLIGAATAGTVLHYDGSEPINLIRVIGLLVLVPGLLLVISLLAQVPWLTRRLSPLGGPLPSFIAQLAGRWSLLASGRSSATSLTSSAIAASNASLTASNGLIHNLLRQRGGHYLYAAVARWQGVSMLQLWGCSCMVGILLGAGWRALGSDLAFAWHSTLIDADTMLALTHMLSLPWGWAMPSAVPDAELIELSRYVLLEGRFGLASEGDRAVDAAALHRWWPFVACTLLTWSLLPRVVVWAWSAWRLRHHLAMIKLDYDDHRQVVARLQHAELGFSSAQPVSDGSQATQAVSASGEWPSACHLLTWIDPALTSQCERSLIGSTIHSRHLLGATADLSAEQQAFAAIAQQPAPVVVVIDAAEPPMTDMMQCLADARMAANQEVIVALAGDEADRDIWRTTHLGDGMRMKELP